MTPVPGTCTGGSSTEGTAGIWTGGVTGGGFAGGTLLWQLVLVGVTVVVTVQGKLHPATMIVVGGAIGIALGR